MKSITYLFSLVFMGVLLGACSNRPENNVTINATSLPGFNVNNFAELIKGTKDPDAIEKAINAPDNDINNLDLNKDGQVDFLKVNESENKIEVIDDVNQNSAVTVATLTVTRNNDRADVQIQGNPSYCGENYHYHSSVSLGEILLLSYLFTPHRYYVPLYHYGYYPSYYRPYTTTTYRTVTRTSRLNNSNGGSNYFKGSSKSYNRSSINNPTRSQRSFSARESKSPVSVNGLGNRSSSSGSRSSGSRIGGRSSFGGGLRGGSFGRRR